MRGDVGIASTHTYIYVCMYTYTKQIILIFAFCHSLQ